MKNSPLTKNYIEILEMVKLLVKDSDKFNVSKNIHICFNHFIDNTHKYLQKRLYELFSELVKHFELI
jgi:hypothetical protein